MLMLHCDFAVWRFPSVNRHEEPQQIESLASLCISEFVIFYTNRTETASSVSDSVSPSLSVVLLFDFIFLNGRTLWPDVKMRIF